MADRAGRDDAVAVMKIAPCPKCHRRNPRAARVFMIKAWMAALALLALTAAIAFGLLQSGSNVVAGLVLLVGGFLLYMDHAKRRFTWKSSPNRVKFIEPASFDQL
jgi:hypothetical protein